MGEQAIAASERAIRETYCHQAEIKIILEDFNLSDDDSDDCFPHKELPIFARNKKIRQNVDKRQRKKKDQATEDRYTWSQ